jgi:hypothetical protein
MLTNVQVVNTPPPRSLMETENLLPYSQQRTRPAFREPIKYSQLPHVIVI